MATNSDNVMHIRLSDERKVDILRRLTEMYARDFDEDLSTFRAAQILSFFVRALGPPVYNQAIQDARKFMAERLDDLDATFYEAEDTGQPSHTER